MKAVYVTAMQSRPMRTAHATYTRQFHRPSFVGALVLVAAACSAGDFSTTKGVVKNSRTSQPIAHATVTAECHKAQAHGSIVLKTLQTHTDVSGVFALRNTDIAPCDYMFVRAMKGGYAETGSVDTRYQFTDYATVPDTLYLTPTEALSLQRLEYISVMSREGHRKLTGELDIQSDYRALFTGLHCSRLVARMPEEIAYVREQYCDRLRSIEARLSASERDRLPSMPPQLCFNGSVAKIDPAEVGSFCGAQ